MTKKEKKELALKLKAEIDAKHGLPVKKEFTQAERIQKKQQELRTRDKAKNRRKSKNPFGDTTDTYKHMDFDKW